MSQSRPPNRPMPPTHHKGGWKPSKETETSGHQFSGYFERPKKQVLTIKSPAGETLPCQSEASQPTRTSENNVIVTIGSKTTEPEPRLPDIAEAEQERNVATKIFSESDNNGCGVGMPDTNHVTQKLSQTAKLTEVGKQSKLNIYAPVHVPDWLVAINESIASQVPCLPLRSFDALEYSASFGALSHIEPTYLHLLPLDEAPEYVQSLERINYDAYFSARLRDEFTALDQQLMHHSLFQHQNILKDAQQLLYEIQVPGLRENSPRLDLGDIVLVRPINPMSSATALGQNKIWRAQLQGRGEMHPAFMGTEYRAVVWGIDRSKEAAILRIDSRCPRTANFRFIVQTHKTAPLFRTVQSIAKTLDSSTFLRSMLFPRRADACMQTKLSPASFGLPWQDTSLNFEQRKAVAAVVSDRYGAVPYLVSGPPGTGKTKTIVETALQLLARKKSGVLPHLIVCAPSDAAADTIALRLSVHLNKDQLFRLNGWTRTFAEVPDRLMLYSYSAPNNMFSLPPFHLLMSYSIVVTTCRDANMLIEARLSNKDLAQLAFRSLNAVSPSAAKSLTLPLLHWTALLLDEAAQATEPDSLIPLSVTLPLWQPPDCQLVCPQFVLAGDEFQLGPRLASNAQKTGLETSLFQRLFNMPFYADHPLSRANNMQPLTRRLLPLPRPAFTNLIRNYRSDPAILAVPSSLFYYDTLVPEYAASSPTVCGWSGWRRSGWPIMFCQHHGLDQVDDILIGDGTGAGSLYNTDEICIVSSRVQTLLNQIPDLKHKEIMVMSPFRAQVAKIRTALRAERLASVNVGPLEAFQGLESRIVILCTTRTRRGLTGDEVKFVKMDQERGLGLIDEPKRFNVAVTRAMEGLIVVGDARTLVCTGDQCWRAFIALCARNGLVEGNIGTLEADIETWNVHEGRLERALKQKAAGLEGTGVIGLRGSREDGEEQGEMTMPEAEDEEVEADGGVESDEEFDDEYETLEGLNLDAVVM